jgi:hypothetical protein
MKFDSPSMNISQPDLLGLHNTISDGYELTFEVWNAAEALSSPDVEMRISGLDFLEQSKATHYFPLIAYLLSTRINDPDLDFRSRVIKLLADILQPLEGDHQALDTVKQQLHSTLSQLQNQEVESLLEVVESNPSLQNFVATLFNYCSHAGEHLALLLPNRRIPIQKRKIALRLIEQLGYLDALPTLERLKKRLNSKVNGQKTFREDQEESLIPELQKAIDCLLAP